MYFCTLSMSTTPDQVKLWVGAGNSGKLHFTGCRVTFRDGSCASPGVVPRCLSLGQSSGPGLRQDQGVLEGKAVCGALQGRAAGGCHPSVTPSPAQGVTGGAVSVPPTDSFPRYPELYIHLKLPVSFLALFKRRNIVLLEKNRNLLLIAWYCFYYRS